MVDNNIETTSETETSNGIWANLIQRLSVRTGLAVHWLHFIGLVIGCLAAFLVSEAFHQTPWDSAALLFRIATVLAAVAAVVVLLPSAGRRIVISLVILFHFGGILTAITSVNPSPWLSTQIWTTVYRPYLYFLWLNNAYHFYSPEPGPANLMWFCIEYEPDPDETKNFRWVLFPDLDEKGRPIKPDGSPVFSGTEYTRYLSLGEYTGNASLPTPWNLYQLLGERLREGELKGIPPYDPRKIVYEQQYREPDSRSKLWIQTYVRHVARTYKHQNKPDRQVVSVKFYRVVHQIVVPAQVNAGLDPNDRSLYLPFYCGKFDKDGKFTDDCVAISIDELGRFHAEMRDPFLYWLIPIDSVARHALGGDLEKADVRLLQAPDNRSDGEKTDVKP